MQIHTVREGIKVVYDYFNLISRGIKIRIIAQIIKQNIHTISHSHDLVLEEENKQK
jgi:hypothetical protein